MELGMFTTLRYLSSLSLVAAILLSPNFGEALTRDARSLDPIVILAVKIEDNQNVVTETIMSMIQVRPGTRFDPVKVNEDCIRLLECGAFQNVTPDVKWSKRGAVVTYRVQEYPNT